MEKTCATIGTLILFILIFESFGDRPAIAIASHHYYKEIACNCELCTWYSAEFFWRKIGSNLVKIDVTHSTYGPFRFEHDEEVREIIIEWIENCVEN